VSSRPERSLPDRAESRDPACDDSRALSWCEPACDPSPNELKRGEASAPPEKSSAAPATKDSFIILDMGNLLERGRTHHAPAEQRGELATVAPELKMPNGTFLAHRQGATGGPCARPAAGTAWPIQLAATRACGRLS
jgi:hypothetical protein